MEKQPQMRKKSAGLLQQPNRVGGEEEQVLDEELLWNREEPEPPQVKDEEEKPWSGQEGELLAVKVEADTFMETPDSEENELSEEEPDVERPRNHNSAVMEVKDEGGRRQFHSGSTGEEEEERTPRRRLAELNKAPLYSMLLKKSPRNKPKSSRPRFSEGQGVGQGGPEVPDQEAAGDADEHDEACERQRRRSGRRIQSAAGPATGPCGFERCVTLDMDTSDSESCYANSHAKKKRKEKTSATLTEAEEDIMLEWLREHPEIYNKKLKDYKNMPKKVALWEEKAFEMGKTVDYLQLWYRSMRTRMSRLLRTKSGQGSEELTERDTWVMDNFSFLRVHIEAVHRRPMKSIAQAPAPMATRGHLESDVIAPHGACPDVSASQNTTAPTDQATQSREADQDENLLASLEDRSAQIMTLQQQLMEQLRPNGDQERLGFTEWVRSTILSLNHNLWRRCQRDMTDLLYRYIEENDAAKQSAPGNGSSSACNAAHAPRPVPTGPAAPQPVYLGPSSGYWQPPPSQQMWQPPPH
ncbi:uncharacterized protein KZ484_020419 [Pholidichthys leucotaenia]